MIRLVHAEFVKLRTTQVWFWLLATALALAALLVIAPIASGTVHGADDVADMFTSAGTAYVVVFVLGILGITTEFRYQTITPTFLATPSRWAVTGAKLITFALVGAGYAAACVLLQAAIALPWLNARGIDASLSTPHVGAALLGVFASVVLFGLIGLGVGALLRNQVVAVSVGVIFVVVVNNVLLAIPKVKEVFPYTPAGGLQSVLTTHGVREANGVTILPPAAGVVVLLLWALIPAVLGAAVTMNRDIT